MFSNLVYLKLIFNYYTLRNQLQGVPPDRVIATLVYRRNLRRKSFTWLCMVWSSFTVKITSTFDTQVIGFKVLSNKLLLLTLKCIQIHLLRQYCVSFNKIEQTIHWLIIMILRASIYNACMNLIIDHNCISKYQFMHSKICFLNFPCLMFMS